ncbi:MAG: 5-formyltetrahydrofolate cyclo-ligase [Nanoarchaeota archaeon]|nr:5-formyltetrahydrofolate cyclo-ligase [Nanoarchaeota archaeon]
MKEKIRQEILRLRNGFSREDLDEKDISIKKRLENLDEFRKAGTVLFYVSFESEVATHSLIREALVDKKNVIVPYIEEKEIFLSKIEDFIELETGKFGILEPKKKFIRKANLDDVNLIIVPGIVFDMHGHRVGFGGGYYDKLLCKTKALKIGMCYEFQIVNDVPVELHDIPVDIIVTEDRIIKGNQKK